MLTIYTIGHSTRPVDEFIDLLGAQRIRQVVDIRRIPRSRHNPQYDQDALRESLEQTGITYVYLKELGGLRSSHRGSPNTAWRNRSFRNYADFMQSGEFNKGVDELIELSKHEVTAIMCAEAVPWRCHRTLVGDALLVRGIAVLDIINAGEPTERTMTSFAVTDGTRITYPAANE